MVTVLLSGGLGNQMFQYAAAKSLAKRLETPLFLNDYMITKKSEATSRDFELGIFNIHEPFSSSFKSMFLTKARPFIQKHRVFFQRFGVLTDTYAILYQPVFETIEGNIVMSGCFQNEKYFKNISSDIRDIFTFKDALAGKNQDLSLEISKVESVSIHIRRGDYITNKSAASNFATCDRVYYEKAFQYILNKTNNPSFYIFSDDLEWAKSNLNISGYPVRYIDWNTTKESYRDMQLMSLCKHNIIANSSFSWWGAWLNNYPEKIVIAPEKWFRDDYKNGLLDDFYPKGWIKL